MSDTQGQKNAWDALRKENAGLHDTAIKQRKRIVKLRTTLNKIASCHCHSSDGSCSVMPLKYKCVICIAKDAIAKDK